MSRRALTTSLAALLAVGLAVLGGVQTVPYVVLEPGPAFNTLGLVGQHEVLSISGRKTYPTDGALDATTVSVVDHVSLFEALRGWLSDSEAVVPRELIYPSNQTSQQTDQQNAQDMRQSQDDAVAAAMKVLGITGTSQVAVAAVSPTGPSQGHLQVGDVITTVNRTPVTGLAALRVLIGRVGVGHPVVVGYVRAGAAGTVTLTPQASTDSTHRPVIGIEASTISHFPVTVDIKLGDVGGPSAGLMFALGILDKLEPSSLTGGRLIAGTGEIDQSGKVGAIGGIAQKMRGAKAAKATVFLVPAANCEEARATKPGGLQLIKVATLQDALSSLEALRSGRTPPSC